MTSRGELIDLRLPNGVVEQLCDLGATAVAAFWRLYRRLWSAPGGRLIDDDKQLASVARCRIDTWRRTRRQLADHVATDAEGRFYIPAMQPRLLWREERRRNASVGGYARRMRDLLRYSDPPDLRERKELEKLRLQSVERCKGARRLHRLAVERRRRMDPNWEPEDPSALDEPPGVDRHGRLFDELHAEMDPIARANERLIFTALHERCTERLGKVTVEDLKALVMRQEAGMLEYWHLLAALCQPGWLTRYDAGRVFEEPPKPPP